MTAALMMTACSSDDNVVEATARQQGEVKTIPYTVTVGQAEDAGTRATVDSDMKTLKFAAGDKLYISGEFRTDVYGVLTLKSGDEGKTSGATFEGMLNFTGDVPADDAELRAVLVSSNNKGVQITSEGKVKDVDVWGHMKYPYDAYCATVNEAVEQYSNLIATSTYGAKSFTLTQQTAFLNFEITFEDGTTTGTARSFDVRSNNKTICNADVTTTTEGDKVVAKFVLPLSQTYLYSPTVRIDNKYEIPFNGADLKAKVYNVKKTQAEIAGDRFYIGHSKKVVFSPGNLQATYDGTSWTWKFAEHQWDYIGNAAGNTSVTDSSPFVSKSNVTVDLFGWVGESSTWDGVNQFGITSSSSNKEVSINGYGNTAERMKKEWNSTNLTIQNGGSYNWRTLSLGGEEGEGGCEWEFILSSRPSGATVNGTSNARYTYATINTDDGTGGVNGVILFPDGCKIISTSATTWSWINSNSNWGTKCTKAQWQHLEALGCVFLPAAGYREGNTVENAGSWGYYWSNATSLKASARDMHFYSGAMYLNAGGFGRHYGFSVRLVREVE